MLCGSARITITAALIVVEVTGMTSYLSAIAIAVLFARLVGDRITHGLYHEQIHFKGFPFLEDIAPSTLSKNTVAGIMESPVVYFFKTVHVERVRHVLATTTHNGFPVLADPINTHGGSDSLATGDSPLVGLVLRKNLLRLLRQAKKDNASTIDCGIVRDESPITVEANFTAAQAFKLFRSMGLRHLTVIDRNFRVVGIITRRTFLKLDKDHVAMHKMADSLAAPAKLPTENSGRSSADVVPLGIEPFAEIRTGGGNPSPATQLPLQGKLNGWVDRVAGKPTTITETALDA
jgi:chloride channel 7